MTRHGFALVLALTAGACTSTAHNHHVRMAVVPQVVPNYPGTAIAALHLAGFGAEIDSLPAVVASGAGGNGYAVIRQWPRAGRLAPVGSDVRLVAEGSVNGGGPWRFAAHSVVPMVVGLSVEDAYRRIADLGLRVTLRPAHLPLHTMRVVAQSVQAGARVHRSTVVVLTLD